MALKKKVQLYLSQELQENVALADSTVVSAASGKYLAIDPSMKFDVQRLQRNISRSTLTPAQGITGLRSANLKFGLEITGNSGGIGAVNQLDTPLKACGYRREALQKVYIDAITGGPFIHGEEVTIGGTTAGICVRHAWDGAPCLYIAYQNRLGPSVAVVAADGDAIVGVTSGASTTADGAGISAAALGYWPVSTPLTILIIGTLADALAVGDVLRGATSKALGVVERAASTGSSVTVEIRHVSGIWQNEVIERVTPNADTNVGSTTGVQQFLSPTVGGALTKDGVWEIGSGIRGNVAFRLPNGDIPVANFDMRGAFKAVVDGVNFTPATPQFTPSPVLAAGFRIGSYDATSYDDFSSPCAALIEIDTGNELAQRQCMNEDSGVLGYQIVSRAPKGTIDPELQPEAFLPVMSRFLNNENSVLEATVRPVDKTLRAGRTFLFQMPRVAITDADTGDRNGVLTRQLTIEPNTGQSLSAATPHDDDIIIVHDFNVDATSGV